jgi:hypothetical protein
MPNTRNSLRDQFNIALSETGFAKIANQKWRRNSPDDGKKHGLRQVFREKIAGAL